MSNSNQGDRHVVLGSIMLAGGGLMILFWSLYLTGAMDLGQHDPLVASFESAFVLADTALGAFLCAAGWALLRRRPAGPFLMVVASAMSLYLGLLDLAFYVRIGLYDSVTGTAVFEFVLNTVCVVGGAACLILGWRLLRPRPASVRDLERTSTVVTLRTPRDVAAERHAVSDRPWWIGGAA